ncbi:SIS domain-containing protein [Desulfatitalea tepidiphila]|uniref:SIS domain-containing protein n=1 Tax=Desulfatitalea tepidiphila TaxID=1185843 RepID=UPI000A5C089B|nr:SIS domain-containing protein [Desulfatitalea tepidiphila]
MLFSSDAMERWLMSTRSRAETAWAALRACGRMPVFWGRCPAHYMGGAWIVFPLDTCRLHCGLAGLIRIQPPRIQGEVKDVASLAETIDAIVPLSLSHCIDNGVTLSDGYLGGDQPLEQLYKEACGLKHETLFLRLLTDQMQQAQIQTLCEKLDALIDQEVATLQGRIGYLPTIDAEIADRRIEKIKDIAWCLRVELLDNIAKTKALMGDGDANPPAQAIAIFRNLNTVLNSIDRLEVRGRDSAGISLLFLFKDDALDLAEQAWNAANLGDQVKSRTARSILGNRSIAIRRNGETGLSGVTLTYKVAAEIGRLGDNVRELRREISTDPLLHLISRTPHEYHTVSAHTRWASVGAITIANCHPVDNATNGEANLRKGMIHACLNGDIDNYLTLKLRWEQNGEPIPEEITTDTKIIPLQIEYYLRQGHSVEEAFRLAVSDFEGSHAIAMHTDLAPGKFFLAQRGSGQAVFVGLAEDHYLPTSEVYGFVEQTQSYIRLNGEKIVPGINGSTQGQIFVLDQNSPGGLSGIAATYYDGTPIDLKPETVQHTEITSRDIDRQQFPHYFLKEISESPVSVARTLQNRWKIAKDDPGRYTIALPENAFPERIVEALRTDRIRRVYFIGQGTAGIAAQAIGNILEYYLNEPSLKISALKASELSGFQLGPAEDPEAMSDALVIAISQSGTTTDTNRAVDMVRARGALTMCIVNRRDSDLTFKVDGVVYTSSGRDIEMSVASTKAFYSQIVAGALISLKIAEAKKRRSPEFIAEEIRSLLALPDQMRRVLALGDQIRASAERLAPMRTYWAAVGSGPNKSAADEIRIKLSELCYKTISSDYVEDKKHIDLSSEPLILICAAGAGRTVIGDIAKDTAIFRAHKAAPVVIADEGETRFDAYAEDIFQVPGISPHLAPILNTLVGHLWGYYAALAINSGSGFLHRFREEIKQTVERCAQDGLDVYEVVLEKSFREQVAQFYSEFRRRLTEGKLPSTIGHAADLLLLLKYLTGRLPVADFELDFGKRGTALNMLDSLFEFLGKSINGMSRPVDAIKHQAKTVTVGTSRISERVQGILFDALADHDISASRLINRNILVLKNLQHVVADIKGSILYRIDNLNVLGEPTDDSTIEIIKKTGVLAPLKSRVESDRRLKGTKRIVVAQGNVYIGKGRKDDRSILIIPAFSTAPGATNRIEQLLLLNIGFQEHVPLPQKIKALGGKYEHIKNIVHENSIAWEDAHLERVPMEELFGRSAEKVGEMIVAMQPQK